MKTLNLVEWSLNLKSDQHTKTNNIFYKEIEKLRNQQEADILFLVETVKENKFVLQDFTKIIESDNSTGNTTTIAIRTDLLENSEIKVMDIKGRIPVVAFCNSPNFCQADVEINNIVYNFIAVRVRVGAKVNVEEFRTRRKQFDSFINYVSTLSNPIIMGDFNNARIPGNMNDSVTDIKNSENKTLLQVKSNFFYQKLKEDFGKEGLLLCTPTDSISQGIKIDNKKNIVNHNDPNWNHKIDHLIIKNENVHCKSISYSWDFWKTIKNSDGVYKIKNGRTVDFNTGVPDHAVLKSTIELKNSVDIK